MAATTMLTKTQLFVHDKHKGNQEFGHMVMAAILIFFNLSLWITLIDQMGKIMDLRKFSKTCLKRFHYNGILEANE